MTTSLYTSKDFLVGFDEADPTSYVRSWDFQQFVTFTAEGRAVPKTLQARLRQTGLPKGEFLRRLQSR